MDWSWIALIFDTLLVLVIIGVVLVVLAAVLLAYGHWVWAFVVASPVLLYGLAVLAARIAVWMLPGD